MLEDVGVGIQGGGIKEWYFNGNTSNQVKSCNDELEFKITNSPYPASQNTSWWLKIIKSGLNVESHHLVSAEKHAKFACVHNCDKNNFMNTNKFERFIFKKTAAGKPFHWELLDETGMESLKMV